jgi:hypothetical protein
MWVSESGPRVEFFLKHLALPLVPMNMGGGGQTAKSEQYWDLTQFFNFRLAESPALSILRRSQTAFHVLKPLLLPNSGTDCTHCSALGVGAFLGSGLGPKLRGRLGHEVPRSD